MLGGSTTAWLVTTGPHPFATGAAAVAPALGNVETPVRHSNKQTLPQSTIRDFTPACYDIVRKLPALA
jgi:hypothetical protein